ncbi:Protein farnesyltransferase subunit beta [Morus notabilis]|uniref:CASP-like protein n=1 Tax=Morus notabilis TaxID=981085 RepID=W9SB72_9ROSA|nr:Protein farnesyltransferase subunit beta [Morus notabilis]
MESETPVQTVTERDQWMVENEVFQIYNFFANAPRDVKSQMLKLRRDRHLEYLDRGLRFLGPSFCVLDAKDKLYTFLQRMKHPSGGFRMHDGGEIDVRACYTAISVASILNILDDELVQDVGNYILSCQTFEGGIAGEPGSEAHGGYTFCGLATMILINEVERLDLTRLIILSYLLMSASSSAATRVDDWQSNWGKDKFPDMARASVGLSFAAFVALAWSSIVSGYILCTSKAS